jgi:hypothetical protein
MEVLDILPLFFGEEMKRLEIFGLGVFGLLTRKNSAFEKG